MGKMLTRRQYATRQPQGLWHPVLPRGIKRAWDWRVGGIFARDLSRGSQLSGSATTNPARLPGGGIRFTAPNDIIGQTGLGSSTDWTTAILVKPNNGTTTQYISDCTPANVCAHIIGFQSGFYNLFGGAYPIGNTAANSQMPVSGGVDALVWRKSGTNLQGWVNGVQYVDGTITHGTFTFADAFRLGRPWSTTSNSLSGNIYQYLFWQEPADIAWLEAWGRNPFFWYTRDEPIFIPSGADVTAPTLTSATGTNTGPTTASGTVDTDEGNGTLYWIVDQSATPPSVAQIQAGNDSGGAAADASGNQAVTGTGTQNVSATGLVDATTYYFHYQHADAATNDSTVVSSASFTTGTVGRIMSSLAYRGGLAGMGGLAGIGGGLAG